MFAEAHTKIGNGITPSTQSRIAYQDPFVTRLAEDIHSLLGGEDLLKDSILQRLLELNCANSPEVSAYWQRTSHCTGIPDTAFKGSSIYLFADESPVRTFLTSGTSSGERGTAHYSRRGLELMNASILANAQRHMFGGLERPAVIRLVPAVETAPVMIMAYGMELISAAFADPELSGSVVDERGVDYHRLEQLLRRAIADSRPVVLIGASFAFANVSERLERDNLRFQLPPRSRIFDAGGSKAQSRVINVEELRSKLERTFGIPPSMCRNLFGMTELASQLYDSTDVPLGPRGERPKCNEAFVECLVRDPDSYASKPRGVGLLEIRDLCILDRPPLVLTGDIGIASPEGVAVIGRVESKPRGCSLVVDRWTRGTVDA